jgi:type VI secretion system secreted protein Hcp
MKIAMRNVRGALLAAGLASLAGSAMASVDYFLKIDGIDGESTDDRHKGEIEITSWSASAATAATTSGKSKGACIKDITFTKTLDKASPLLLANAVSGMNIPAATFVARKAGKDQQEYLKIELKDVIITSVQDAGSTGESVPMESITLGFGSLNLQYKAQKPDGSLGDVVQTTVKGGC